MNKCICVCTYLHVSFYGHEHTEIHHTDKYMTYHTHRHSTPSGKSVFSTTTPSGRSLIARPSMPSRDACALAVPDRQCVGEGSRPFVIHHHHQQRQTRSSLANAVIDKDWRPLDAVQKCHHHRRPGEGSMNECRTIQSAQSTAK